MNFSIDFQAAQWRRICLPLQEMQETRVLSLGREDPLEEEMVAHSSTVAWGILWTAEPGGPQSMGLQRVRRDWATEHTHILKDINSWGTLRNDRRWVHCSLGDVVWRRRTCPVALDPPPPTRVLFLLYQGQLADAVKTIAATRLKPATADDSCSFPAQSEKPGAQS